jgi:predicted O-methyltransferase YrrM
MDPYLEKLKYSSFTKRWPSQKKQNLLYSLDKCTVDGLYLEFGVFQGDSINAIAYHVPHQHIYGFDSFFGLPEPMDGIAAGTFNQDGQLPKVADNVTLVPGLYKHTLPAFPKQQVSFMHIDCDLYSSTKCIFDHFKNYISKGTIIVFDEFFGLQLNQTNSEKHEYRAFMEFLDETKKDYRVLSLVNDTFTLSVMMLS